ncbi:Creatinase aminopeptidase [Russula aff. rugulosa BPL654]|nr:Creatinase aminopeptidase [Russula aff. rugulosa BPL654]
MLSGKEGHHEARRGKKKKQQPDEEYFDEKSASSHHSGLHTPHTRSSRGSRSRSSLPPSHRPSQAGSPLARSASYSPTATITDAQSRAEITSKAEKLTFTEDTESYNNLPRVAPKLDRSRTKLTRGGTFRSKFGYGWGLGLGRKDKDKEDLFTETPTRHMSQRSKASHASKQSKDSQASRATKASNLSGGSKRSNNSRSDSVNTLVGSALQRKETYQDPIRERTDTTTQLAELRQFMAKDNLDYYVIPSEDAHQSEYPSEADKRREWISNFTGSAGQAIVSKTTAYLLTDSRYWLQAEKELDENWRLIRLGMELGPRNWVEWISDRVNESRVGVDARMISNETAQQLYPLLQARKSKLVYPSQNLIDLIWVNKPVRPKNKIFVQPIEYTGKDAARKLVNVRDWIRDYTPSAGTSPSKNTSSPSQRHVGTLVTNLASIAYVLNLRGDDIPFNPVFVSYMYIGLDRAILFVEQEKIEPPVRDYLQNLRVEIRDYNGIWSFLRTREWGEGKVIISPQTSYAISLMLTHYRYSLSPSIIEEMKGVKNEVEIQGVKRAHRRDGACYVQFLAWMDEKMSKGFEISEWEAAWRLTEFRRKAKNYMGLAYENISATGPNAALPHYHPLKSDSYIISKDSPYLNDSGGQYRDGTCDTTRTMHYGRPTLEQSEAYTRVLQGHIAIDTAVFPKGTTGAQLDVLARKNLWQDGLNYLHGTGHGVGSFLNVHEGFHGFSSNVPLVPGHVLTNEPGYYKTDEFGVRIDVQTKHTDPDESWYGFERLTCVPIQTRMVLEHMLTKEEKEWLREHNRRCLHSLEDLLQDDKRALKWLRREAERPIGVAPAGPGGVIIDWGE